MQIEHLHLKAEPGDAERLSVRVALGDQMKRLEKVAHVWYHRRKSPLCSSDRVTISHLMWPTTVYGKHKFIILLRVSEASRQNRNRHNIANDYPFAANV
jgi:hypothetical protein